MKTNKMAKTLSLTKETVANLNGNDMKVVKAGIHTVYVSCNPNRCITFDDCTAVSC